MISPDDVARALLIKKADGYFWGLIWSTVVLFLGAIMEEVHPLNRLATHNVNTRTRVRTPRRWVLWSQKTYGVLAVMFVIGGIGGEGIFEYLGAKAETTVRNFDNRIAVAAQGEAIEAGTAATGAVDDLKIAHKQLNTLTKKAGVLDRQLDATKSDLDASKSQLADAEAAERKEQLALFNMAVCNAPRVIPPQMANGKDTADPLRPYAGFKASIEYQEFDPEARRAAINLATILKTAKWSVTVLPPVDGLADGVVIGTYTRYSHRDAITDFHQERAYEDQSAAPGKALADFLHSYNWEAKVFPDASEGVFLDGIKVKVGLYPAATAFVAHGGEELAIAVDANLKKLQEYRKRIDAESIKGFEKLVEDDSTLTPEQKEKQIAEFRKGVEQTAGDVEKSMHDQPCSPLIGFFNQ